MFTKPRIRHLTFICTFPKHSQESGVLGGWAIRAIAPVTDGLPVNVLFAGLFVTRHSQVSSVTTARRSSILDFLYTLSIHSQVPMGIGRVREIGKDV